MEILVTVVAELQNKDRRFFCEKCRDRGPVRMLKVRRNEADKYGKLRILCAPCSIPLLDGTIHDHGESLSG